MNTSVNEASYRWPAEWEKQDSVWFSWPANKLTWQNYQKAAIEAYQYFLPLVLKHQDVHLLVPDNTVAQDILNFIGSTAYTLHTHCLPYNDSWIRDYGGLSVFPQSASVNNSQKNSSAPQTPVKPHILNFGYNAWGGKYPPWDADNLVPVHMANILGVESHTIPLILEGGSVDVNGQGLGLTTASCLLNNNRNPGILKYQIEDGLGQLLGVKSWIWLSGGIEGDDTDGHIDQLARFTDPQTVVYAQELNTNRPNFHSLSQNKLDLQRAATQHLLNLVPLPMPTPYELGSFSPPACYLNFLILNQALLVPQFGVPEDDLVLKILESLFPRHTLYPLYSRELVFGQGGIHCLSQCSFAG